MLRSLIVGLGRSGLGLHAPVLARLAGTGPFAAAPPLGYDPAPAGDRPTGLTVVPTLAAAAREHPPAGTVVHLCTLPDHRIDLLRELAALGYRRILVEKPLAGDRESLVAVERLRIEAGLQLVVVAQWLSSALTRRLERLVADAPLRRIDVAQHKPRFRRGLAATDGSTAFDIEVPHSIGVALRLAGPATLAHAAWSDLAVGDRVVPRLGRAHVVLRHVSGVETEIVSDLGSPVRERRFRLEFASGVVTGHYPVSADDEYAQLIVDDRPEVFRDDSLSSFFAEVYATFAGRRDTGADYAIGYRVAELVCEAKERHLVGGRRA